jgi:2-dehydropantoate 2-reductase
MAFAIVTSRSHCILRFTSIGVLAGILGRCTGFAFPQNQQQRQPTLPRQSPRFTCRSYQPVLSLDGSVIGRNQILPHRFSSSLSFISLSSQTDTGSNTDTDETSRPMNVAVVGAGAVGSYYGARLWEAGHSVTFYMRGEHYESSKRDGLTVTSVIGDIRIPADQLHTVNDTSAVTTPLDWVVVALKSSSLEAIPDLIYPMLSLDTRILVIMNGLVEDDLIKMLKERAGEKDMEAPLECCQALYGGMAVICVNRLAPGKIDHSFAGLLAAGVACSRTEDPEEDQAAFEDLWAPSLVKTDYEQCLLRGRWKKMIWNLPFNGISVAMGGITVDRIVTDPDLRRLVDIVMDEVIATANADLDRKYKYGIQGFEPLGDTDKKMMMGLSDVSTSLFAKWVSYF